MLLPWHGKGPIHVLGVPYEGPITGAPGCALAPDAIRKAAEFIEAYSYDYDVDVSKQITDLGNIYVSHDVERALDDISDAVRGLKNPIVLGGSHTVTLGVLRALNVNTVVYIDAHWDLRDEYMGERYSHACVARRLIEDGKKVLFLGVRSGTREEWTLGKQYIWYGVERWPDIEGNVYITLDMDVFDPAFAPGVGTPEPGGISPSAFFAWLRRIPAKIVGADIVEVNPLIEGWRTPILAAKVVRELAAKMISGKAL